VGLPRELLVLCYSLSFIVYIGRREILLIHIIIFYSIFVIIMKMHCREKDTKVS
jgi:hypothetical protein